GDGEAESVELLQFGFTQIETQKSGRQQEKRQLVAVDQRRAFGRVQWIRIRNDAHTFDKRIPKRDCRSERVEKRQRGENRVRLLRIKQFPELRDISHHVAVTHHCSLGFTSGTACKKQHCFSVPALFRNIQKPQKQTGWKDHRYDPPQNNLALHTREKLVQRQNAFRPRKIFHAFNEWRR